MTYPKRFYTYVCSQIVYGYSYTFYINESVGKIFLRNTK